MAFTWTAIDPTSLEGGQIRAACFFGTTECAGHPPVHSIILGRVALHWRRRDAEVSPTTTEIELRL